MRFSLRFDSSVDDHKFRRAMHEYARQTKLDARSVLRKQMRLLVERLIQLTPPPTKKGATLQGKRMGEAAVKRDIKWVFFSHVRTKKGKIVPVAHPSALSPEAHRKARGADGRIHYVSKRLPVRGADLRAYIRTIQKHVGLMKGGWNAAAERFGYRGAPAWVKRHGTEDGDAVESFSGTRGYVEAVNHALGVAWQDSHSRIVQTALDSRARDVGTDLRLMAERAARRASR